MSGTRSPSPTAPATDRAPAGGGRWPVWRLALLLYPFAAGAAAINLFMLGLMGRAFGLGVLAPVPALLGGLALGVPAAALAGRWVRRLMDEAED